MQTPDLSNYERLDPQPVIDPGAIRAGAPPYLPYPQATLPFMRSPLPASYTTETDALRQFHSAGQGGTPQTRMVPQGPAAKAALNAAARSQVIDVIQSGEGLPLLTNGKLNATQSRLNLIAGNDVSLSADAFGGVTISGGGGDGLVHGDAIWVVDPAVIGPWRDDFYFGSNFAGTGGSNTLGELRWDLVQGSGVVVNKITGYAPHIGQIRIDSEATSPTCAQIFGPRGSIPDSGTSAGGVFSSSLPLLDYPGWKMIFVFGFPVGRGGILTSVFPLTKTQFYCGLSPLASTSVTWAPNGVNARPPFFVGLRYDTDPGVGTLTLSSAATASGGTTVYTGTITNGGSTFVNKTFTVAGFTNAQNNGSFICTAATTTTLTLANPSGIAETHAATATDASIADSTFHFEAVANPNDNSNRINTQGTVVDTGIAPKENVYYRLEMICASAGVVTLNLFGDDGSNATATLTAPKDKVVGNKGGNQIVLTAQNGTVQFTQSLSATSTNSNMSWGPGSMVTISGATNSYFNKTWTVGGDALTGHWVIYTGDTVNISEVGTPGTQTGYPGQMPYFAFGNDSQSSPQNVFIGLDFWSLVINPGLAGLTPNSAKSRYW